MSDDAWRSSYDVGAGGHRLTDEWCRADLEWVTHTIGEDTSAALRCGLYSRSGGITTSPTAKRQPTSSAPIF